MWRAIAEVPPIAAADDDDDAGNGDAWPAGALRLVARTAAASPFVRLTTPRIMASVRSFAAEQDVRDQPTTHLRMVRFPAPAVASKLPRAKVTAQLERHLGRAGPPPCPSRDVT